MPQDMPPKGGYEAVQYKRNIPQAGLRPGRWLLGMGMVMAYGWYKLIPGIREYNELAREKVWARIYLAPIMQAEEDRQLVRRHLADQEREKQFMGRLTSPYNSDKFVKPTYVVTPLQEGGK